jgi:hypothetical protein
MAYADDIARLQRRRMLAQALIQQGGQPQGQQAGRIYVAPTPLSTLGSLAGIAGGALLDRKLEKEEKAAKETERKRLSDALRGFMGPDSSAPPNGVEGSQGPVTPPDPKREAALAVLGGLPIEQIQGVVGQQAIASLFPKPKELKQVDLGNEIGWTDEAGNIVRKTPKGAAPQGDTTNKRDYDAAYPKNDYPGGYAQWLKENKPAGTTVNVNTKGAGAMADALGGERGKAISALHEAAQTAPQTIERAERVKELLQTEPYTGDLAEWKLRIGKRAKALGFDYAGDDLSNTEMLARELGQNVLDSVKSSGLAGSQGLTEGERKFLLQIVGGTIELDENTLPRVAELNQKMARKTMERWNAEAARIEAGNPGLLNQLGMTTIDMPADTAAPGARPKLQKNPDGSLTYTP